MYFFKVDEEIEIITAEPFNEIKGKKKPDYNLQKTVSGGRHMLEIYRLLKIYYVW